MHCTPVITCTGADACTSEPLKSVWSPFWPATSSTSPWFRLTVKVPAPLMAGTPPPASTLAPALVLTVTFVPFAVAVMAKYGPSTDCPPSDQPFWPMTR